MTIERIIKSSFPFFAAVVVLAPLIDGRMGASVERSERIKAVRSALAEVKAEVYKKEA